MFEVKGHLLAASKVRSYFYCCQLKEVFQRELEKAHLEVIRSSGIITDYKQVHQMLPLNILFTIQTQLSKVQFYKYFIGQGDLAESRNGLYLLGTMQNNHISAIRHGEQCLS